MLQRPSGRTSCAGSAPKNSTAAAAAASATSNTLRRGRDVSRQSELGRAVSRLQELESVRAAGVALDRSEAPIDALLTEPTRLAVKDVEPLVGKLARVDEA